MESVKNPKMLSIKHGNVKRKKWKIENWKMLNAKLGKC